MDDFNPSKVPEIDYKQVDQAFIEERLDEFTKSRCSARYLGVANRSDVLAFEIQVPKRADDKTHVIRYHRFAVGTPEEELLVRHRMRRPPPQPEETAVRYFNAGRFGLSS
jgi:hypothetical protein